eukprot:1271096-Pleurochrysis_carterae.AAC.1
MLRPLVRAYPPQGMLRGHRAPSAEFWRQAATLPQEYDTSCPDTLKEGAVNLWTSEVQEVCVEPGRR